jgi:phosphosulfolactate phosphohydrolase-like enzyme
MTAPRPSGVDPAADKTVAVDVLPGSVDRYPDCDAVVCIDVILDCTALVTAAAAGRRAVTARTLEEALALIGERERPLYCADPGAVLRPGTRHCSLLDVVQEDDPARPLVVAGSPGAELIANAASVPALYLACLRNVSATVDWLAARHRRVVLIGAGSGGDYRCEDQMVAAWMGRRLLERGFSAQSMATNESVTRWGEADAALAGWGKSAEELRRRGRYADLELVLGCVDDLALVCMARGGEVRAEPAGKDLASQSGSAA